MLYLRVPERWIFFIDKTIIKVVPEDKQIVIVDDKVCGRDLYVHMQQIWKQSNDLRQYNFPFYCISSSNIGLGKYGRIVLFMEDGWNIINRHLVDAEVIGDRNEQ